jgi:hypothetical protein
MSVRDLSGSCIRAQVPAGIVPEADKCELLAKQPDHLHSIQESPQKSNAKFGGQAIAEPARSPFSTNSNKSRAPKGILLKASFNSPPSSRHNCQDDNADISG